MGRPVQWGVVTDRAALVARMLVARGGDLVVVTAPAGYGKSTALTQWDDTDPRPFAWLRLDLLDHDPVHLLLHIATAVHQVVPIDQGVLRYLRGPSRDPLTRLVPALAQALEPCGPLVLVLDDTHELSNPAAVETLQALVEMLPATTTTVLAGRFAPALELARRRLTHRVIEFCADELKLSPTESTAVFTAIAGPSDDAAVGAALEKCEGWAAGVVLMAMALRDGAGAEVLSGRHHLVAEYLVEEVLSHLDAPMTTFLHEAAVLDQFTVVQLDAVRAADDSAQRVAALRRTGNLFLVALDAEGGWYRMHRLFGDLLRTRLRDRDPERFRALATRAADVLELEGDVDGALSQALVAGDRGRAAVLVGRNAVRLGFDGRAGVLARRLGQLDERTFVAYPDAAIARAWLGVTLGDAPLIQQSLLLARQADRGAALADGTPSVKVAAALVGSVVGVGGVGEVVRHANAVRYAGDHLSNPWWGAATVMKGAATSMLGDSARARVLLESALPVVDDLPGFRAAALAHLALLDLDVADEINAVARSSEALEIVEQRDLSDVVPMIVVYAVAALVAARRGDAEAARESVRSTERLLGGLGNLAARTALLGHVLLARAAIDLDDTALLHTHQLAAQWAGRREPDAAGLHRRLAQIDQLVADQSGRPALTAAEMRLLPHLATNLSLQRIADELVVGRETAKSQAASIYRKLSVSSRGAAVAEARRLGILAT